MPLALTRTEGQAILHAVDGREIRIEVARLGEHDVRLAIAAPDDVAIWRAEVVDS